MTRLNSRICTSACGMPMRCRSMRLEEEVIGAVDVQAVALEPAIAGSPWRMYAVLRARSNAHAAVLRGADHGRPPCAGRGVV